MKTFSTMFKIELKLSLRGIDMLIFAFCLPLVLLIILGMIYGNKPAFEGTEYTFLEQSFGALTSISICAGGIMGLPLLISDYRGKKILKRFKVTPVSPIMILAVHVAVYTLYALASLLSLFITAKLFWGYRLAGSWAVFLVGYFLVILSMFSIGIMVGGIARDIKIAGVIASILYFPMLILSGATLPYEVMPAPLQKAADMMPLTHGIKLLKSASLGLHSDNLIVPVFIMICISIICVIISVKFFKWE